MINPKEVQTVLTGATYLVPYYQVTNDGLTDGNRHNQPSPCKFHFCKGNKADESVLRQQGFLTETLLTVCKMYLEDVNVGDLKSEQTSAAIVHIDAAIRCLDARAAARKAAGVQGTYQPTPPDSGAMAGEPEGGVQEQV